MITQAGMFPLWCLALLLSSLEAGHWATPGLPRRGRLLINGTLRTELPDIRVQPALRRRAAQTQCLARRYFEEPGAFSSASPHRMEPGIEWGPPAFQRGMGTVLASRRTRREHAAAHHARELALYEYRKFQEDLVRRGRALVVVLVYFAATCVAAACTGVVIGGIVAASASPALLARPPQQEFDSTLGYPGEGPAGDRTDEWDVSIQPGRGRVPSCRCCHTPFDVSQVRVSSRGTTIGKYFHPHCIAAGLGPLTGIQGYTQLPPDAQGIIDQFVDRPGATRADYLDTKRRRLDMAPAAADDPIDDVDVDGVFEDGTLHHMDWWDSVTFDHARQDWVGTVGSVPEAMLLAVADARTAVLESVEAAPAGEKDI